MERKWTEDQQKVIDARDSSVLVSAAAGSGKTAVLVERIIGMVTDEKAPVDIDRILVVTFTRAAAREMKERIYSSLSKLAAKDPGNLRLQRQMTLAFGAPISTIDSFAASIVGNYYYCIGLSPEVRMGDDGELKLLAQSTMDELMEREYEKGGTSFTELVLAYRSRERDGKLVDMIFSLHESAMSHPYPEEYLDSLLKPYEIENEEELGSLSVMRDLLEQAVRIISEAIELEESLIKELLECSGEEEHPYVQTLRTDINQLSSLLEGKDHSGLCSRFMGFSFTRLSSKKAKFDDSDIRQKVKTTRELVKDNIGKLAERFVKTPEDIINETALIRGQVKELIRLTKEYGRAFSESKLEKKIMDFSDLEHFALNILIDRETGKPGAVAQSLRSYYHEVMVDEYQDSNYLQELLLSAVADTERNYFMVGDVKQSIYSFRQARPDIFTGKYETYKDGEAAQRRIDLSLNFRSRRDVLDVTNETFSLFMDRRIGLVDYDDRAALSCGASYPEREGMDSELYLVAKDDPALFDEDISSIELEARLIGQRIRQLIKEDGFSLSDIAILHRNANKAGEKIAGVLKGMGIEAALPSKSGYFDSPEVETVLSLLSVISNPYEDIALCSVLVSFFGGFSNEELLLIRTKNRENSFAEAFLEGDFEELPESIREKREGFLSLLSDYRERSKVMPVDELLEYILTKSGFVAHVMALPGGGERKANLEALSDMAVSYSKTSYQGIYHFIGYIEKRRKYEIDVDTGGSGSAADQVSIVTIHKSKGLEYPVVFICGMGDSLIKKEPEFILHPRYGLGLTYYDPERSVKYKTFYKNLLLYLQRNEILGEEMRVLYVAMTRAKEKLIMTAAMTGEKIDERMNGESVPDETLPLVKRLAVSTYADLVIPAFLRPKRKNSMKKVMLSDLITEEVVFESKRKSRRDLIGLISDDRADDEEAGRMVERTGYVYDKSSGFPWKSKYSVSMIKHEAMSMAEREENAISGQMFEEEPDSTPYIPQFKGSVPGENKGALRGTAMHRFLECFNFALSEGASAIDREIKRQTENGLLTNEQADLLSKKKLAHFLSGELFKRMQRAYAAGQLKREQAFVMGGKPERFFSDIAEDESVFSEDDPMVIVQGIIDAFFIEEGRLFIVDYKTDRIDSADALERKYKKQMLLYADALSRAKKLPVGGMYLYSFAIGKTVEVRA